MKKESIIRVTIEPCPKCGSKRYRYNAPEARGRYENKVVVKKYECLICGEQVE